ncbi:MAG: hypothetical protein QXD25_01965 [Nanopusillaceae archaeon]
MKAIIDTIFIASMIFLAIIITLVSISIFNMFLNQYSQFDPNNKILEKRDVLNNVLVNVLFLIIFGLPLAGIVLSLFFGSNPAILPIAIIFLFITVFLSTIFKDVIIDVANTLPETNVIKFNNIFATFINYYPFITFVIGMIIVIAQLINKNYVQ